MKISTKLHPFSRDLYLASRIRSGCDNPYHAEVSDFLLPRTCDNSEIAKYGYYLLSSFDSFRTLLEFGPDGQLYAKLIDSMSFAFFPVEGSNISMELANKALFLSKHHGLIDLFKGPTVILYYFTDKREKLSLLRILCSHFSTDFISREILKEQTHAFFRRSNARSRFSSYVTWMDTYLAYARSRAGTDEHRFWSTLPIDAFRRAQEIRLSRAGHSDHVVDLYLPLIMLSQLVKKCKGTLACRLVDIVTLIIVQATAEEYGLSCLPVSWTGHGRFSMGGRSFIDTVGWLSDFHPILFSLRAKGEREIIQSFRDFYTTIPNFGSSFRWVSRFGPQTDHAELEIRLQTPFAINYRKSKGSNLRGFGAMNSTDCSKPMLNVQSTKQTSALPFTLTFTVDLNSELKISSRIIGAVSAAESERLMRSVYDKFLYFTQTPR